MTKFALLIEIACIFLLVNTANCALKSCAYDVPGFRFDVDKVSGVWYEILRAPPSDVPACVAVNASSEIEDDLYTLQLDYINNMNKKWVPTSETLQFPWNNDTQNGVFKIQYGEGSFVISFVFKLIATDYENIAAVCYYPTVAPSLSMLKVLTRQREINATFIEQAQKLLDEFEAEVTWVEQSSRCNGGAERCRIPTALVLFAIYWLLKSFRLA